MLLGFSTPKALGWGRARASEDREKVRVHWASCGDGGWAKGAVARADRKRERGARSTAAASCATRSCSATATATASVASWSVLAIQREKSPRAASRPDPSRSPGSTPTPLTHLQQRRQWGPQLRSSCSAVVAPGPLSPEGAKVAPWTGAADRSASVSATRLNQNRRGGPGPWKRTRRLRCGWP